MRDWERIAFRLTVVLAVTSVVVFGFLGWVAGREAELAGRALARYRQGEAVDTVVAADPVADYLTKYGSATLYDQYLQEKAAKAGRVRSASSGPTDSEVSDRERAYLMQYGGRGALERHIAFTDASRRDLALAVVAPLVLLAAFYAGRWAVSPLRPEHRGDPS